MHAIPEKYEPLFRKSTYSGALKNDCVEVADLPVGQHAVRDTQNRDLGALLFGADAWDAFLGGVKRDEFA